MKYNLLISIKSKYLHFCSLISYQYIYYTYIQHDIDIMLVKD